MINLHKLSLAYACLTVSALGQVTYQNPVLPGDYPDPSVIRVGQDFYATATTSEWAPLFPILHSRDLVNWTNTGSVFHKRPDWAVGNFWAPEIAQFKGHLLHLLRRSKTEWPPLHRSSHRQKPARPLHRPRPHDRPARRLD
jgi:hypothetical protein